MNYTVSKDRLKLFLAEVSKLRFEMHKFDVVYYKDVRRLLINLASGQAPDTPIPPSWSGKDVVGHLLRRGWKITSDGEGLQRRGFFISAEAIRTCTGGNDSAADVLEIEAAQRTDRKEL
jgi:hypothetical protein